jgi:hypothetical protein
MSTNTPVDPYRRLPDVLGLAASIMRQWYPDYEWSLIGEPASGDPRSVVRVPCPGGGPGSHEPEPFGLDGLLSDIRRVVPARFPDAEHAALMVERPGLPATVIPIRL